MKNIEKMAKVDMGKILKLAQSFNGANFQDEKTVRNLINQVSKVAGKPVPKSTEDKLVQTITSNKQPKDFNQLSKMMKKK